MPSNSLSPDALLRRNIVAQALTDAGYPVSHATLATMASRGGGPPYRLWGRIPIYQWGESLGWAKARLSTPRRSTSEAVCTAQSVVQPVHMVTAAPTHPELVGPILSFGEGSASRRASPTQPPEERRPRSPPGAPKRNLPPSPTR
jgi:hypothetical protein